MLDGCIIYRLLLVLTQADVLKNYYSLSSSPHQSLQEHQDLDVVLDVCVIYRLLFTLTDFDP